MTFVLTVCLVLCLLSRGLYLRALVTGHERVYARSRGLFRWELWRRASLVAHSDGMGGQTWPRPRECRCLLVRLCGIPMWREAQSIALPNRVADSIQAVQVHEFDAAFASRFRCMKGDGGGPGQLASPAADHRAARAAGNSA